MTWLTTNPSFRKESSDLRQTRHGRTTNGTLFALIVGLIYVAVVMVLIWGMLSTSQPQLSERPLPTFHAIHELSNALDRTRNAFLLVIAKDNYTNPRPLVAAIARSKKLVAHALDQDLIRRHPEIAGSIASVGRTLEAIENRLKSSTRLAPAMIRAAANELASAEGDLSRAHSGIERTVYAVLNDQTAMIDRMKSYMPVALVALVVLAAIAILLYGLHRKTLKRLLVTARNDALTGIPNRASFLERCHAFIKSSDVRSFALVLVDLDRFKEVNDAFGHQVGDRLLLEVAHYFESNTRQGDFIGRLGGDEFVMLIRDVATADDIKDFMRRIGRPLQGYINLNRFNVPVSCSMGMAFYPKDGDTLDTLMRNADLALYEAKYLGNGLRITFTNALLEKYANRIDMEHRLRQALLKDEFFLVWQPQFDLKTGSVKSLESLVRWYCPLEERIIPPDEFLPIAEESGLVAKIDLKVLEMACRQAEEWRHGAIGPLRVAVNMSGHHFRSTAVVGHVMHVLETTGLPPELLEVEITENVLFDSPSVAGGVVQALRNAGVGVALDDFGTGYSNFSRLCSLPLTSLKIDRSFVQALSFDAQKQQLLHIMIALGRTLGQTVIAEGVETWQHFEFLLNTDCEILQGFLISRPMPTAEFEAWFLDADNIFTDFKFEALQEILRRSRDGHGKLTIDAETPPFSANG